MPLSLNIDFGFEWLPGFTWFYKECTAMDLYGTWFLTGWSQRSLSHNPKMLVWWVKIYFILASFFYLFFIFLLEYLLRK